MKDQIKNPAAICIKFCGNGDIHVSPVTGGHKLWRQHGGRHQFQEDH